MRGKQLEYRGDCKQCGASIYSAEERAPECAFCAGKERPTQSQLVESLCCCGWPIMKDDAASGKWFHLPSLERAAFDHEAMPAEQPAPIANALPAVWSLVMQDMATRDAIGRARYGVPLQPHNGRDALRDAFEEALDLCAYLRQAIFERDGK